MKRLINIMLLTVLLPLAAAAQEWTDITDRIVNPSFENNSITGWQRSWSGSSNIRCSALEFWQSTCEAWQTISGLPAGDYRLSVQAYYRAGRNVDAYDAHLYGYEEMTAVLYVYDSDDEYYETPLPSVYDYSATTPFSTEWWQTGNEYYPNSMETAREMFDQGYYNVSLEFYTKADNFNIGVYNGTYLADNWCIMTNFRLEYKGSLDDVRVEEFRCYNDDMKMQPGDKALAYTYVYPILALENNPIEWHSEDTSVATVNQAGVVTATGTGQTNIVGLCGGERVSFQVTVETLDDSNRAWIDVTGDYLLNADLSYVDQDWLYNRSSGYFYWRDNTVEMGNNTFDFWQTIDELPEGYYRVSCSGFYCPENTAWDAVENYDNNTSPVALYANSAYTSLMHIGDQTFDQTFISNAEGWYESVPSANDDYAYVPGDWTADIYTLAHGAYAGNSVMTYVTEGGSLMVGICKNRKAGVGRAVWSNFKVEYYAPKDKYKVTDFYITSGDIHLLPQNTRQVQTEVHPANAYNQDITWSTDNPSVATVDANGVVTAVGSGTCKVLAECAGFLADATVYVEDTNSKGWVDVTDMYIANADMSEAYDGWDCSRSGGNYNYTYGAAELWNNSFDFYQDLYGLPKGFYRLSCQGYDSKTPEAVIFAGNDSSPLRRQTNYAVDIKSPVGLSSSYSYWDDNGDWHEYYRPDNFEAAAWYLANNYYDGNQVVTYVPEGQEWLTIGLRVDTYVASRWVVFDNFRLEYFTSIVPTQSVTITDGLADLTLGQEVQLGFALTPQDATYQKVVWTSSDTNVLTVTRDGVVKAVGDGTAVITATSWDNPDIKATLTVTTNRGGDATQLAINEVMSMNIDQFVDPSWNYGGWIELYNPTAQPIALSGCYVTEDPENLTQFRLYGDPVVPAYGYYTIWFDHHSDDIYPSQVDFKLSTGGDWIALVSSQGEVLAQVNYPAGVARTSWARVTDGADQWAITAQPTPGASNNTSTFATERLAAPTVDIAGCISAEETITIHASWPEGSTLYYTLDGSTPTTASMISEDGVFTFANSENEYEDWEGNIQTYTNYYYCTLRLCAIQDGKLPSPVETNTYMYRMADYTIPVLVVSGDEDDFFSDERGIFVRGTNGLVGDGSGQPWNVYQDWDRPATFELFAPSGERIFRQDVDVTPAGGWTRTTNYGFLHTSFKLKANKLYEGAKAMDYPFFANKPYLKHKALQIRNGGNDYSRFKDLAIQNIVMRSGLYIDAQEGQPVIHFINGRYGRLFNMREPNNKHHAYANYGYDSDFMDQFELSKDMYNQKEGTRDAFDKWCQLAEQCADPNVYQYICDNLVDIDEFVNYMAVGTWLGNNDWITNTNNVKGYRTTEGDGGRFHFVLFDTDQSFSYSNILQQIDNMSDYNEEVAKLWKDMLRNDQFRKKFVDALCLVSGSVFEPQRCQQVIDSLYAISAPMMAINGEQWRIDDTYSDLMQKLGGSGSRRDVIIYNNLSNYYRFNDETQKAINVTLSSNVPQATMQYNNMDVPTGRFTGTVFLPVTVKAGTPAGYKFDGWVSTTVTSSSDETLLPEDAEWLFYDQGSLDGKDWMAVDYNGGWDAGYAPLGYDTNYGDMFSKLNTELSYGGNRNDKHPTYYFRTNFTLDRTLEEDDVVNMTYTVDDGCIIYLNGTEVLRDNMRQGDISFSDFAVTYEYKTVTATLPKELLRRGKNVLAVEVHNNNATSSDIMWSANVTLQTQEQNYISTNPELELTEDMYGAEIVASYSKLDPEGTEDALASCPPVRINEVSASNATYANEFFKRVDWLELYNTTDHEVDVAGFYLSDNMAKPEKYQIPTQLESGIPTVIPPHGHMIVWCDKVTGASQMHAGFKLSADSAYVMLMSPDHTWTDYLNYPPHDSYHTAGRYPDGADEAYLLTIATPAAVNQMSSYAEAYDLLSLPDDYLTPARKVEATTLALSFDGYQLASSQSAAIEVYSTSGELLMSVPEARTVGLAALRPGIYIARAKAGSETTTLKFRK